ncbi:hypothetical protein K438DRAFT_2154113 [Mycena galopus ATCC 62051]|nr:hypothetical protein K438DRAFT_2154113 [Mycena galopus ATCC 62051]
MDAHPDHEAHTFFMQCNQISNEAQFLVDALPNVETEAVERLHRQLNAIKVILLDLNDPHSSPADLEPLVSYIDSLLIPLDGFLTNPPPAPHTHIPVRRTGNRGRPEYALDLNRAILLHDLGNTWEDIAVAMGVSRATIYNHLDKYGLSSARKEWSELTDYQLDEIVSEISLSHPFVGNAIVMGHLEARQIHLPRARWTALVFSFGSVISFLGFILNLIKFTEMVRDYEEKSLQGWEREIATMGILGAWMRRRSFTFDHFPRGPASLTPKISPFPHRNIKCEADGLEQKRALLTGPATLSRKIHGMNLENPEAISINIRDCGQ